MLDVDDILRRNLDDVERRIAEACRRAGRRREEVMLVAVTKYVDVDIARRLHQLGVTELGESRPQELWKKAAAIPEAHWHLVGHLQRNKVERVLPLVHLIHSVDSFRLLEALEAEATKRGQAVPAFLEFNLGSEESKHGLASNDVPLLLEALTSVRNVRLYGLMTMAAFEPHSESVRPTFAALRLLRDKLKEEIRRPHLIHHLSMGMTNDFEVAIEEGATIVRIGSALFRGLPGIDV